MLKNDRLLKALARQPLDRPPVWLMRQAGRYLPEYRRVREQAGSFMNLCKNPELACEVTLQPIDRFGFDAAILFSDILTIPDAMQLGLYFSEGEGPKFSKPITCLNDIEQLPHIDVNDELAYVFQAVKTIKSALASRVPLIGFAGSPWTLACYMVEGGASKQFAKIKRLRYNHPQATHTLLQKLSQVISEYLQAQIAAGADVVMLFDSWGGILTPADYQQFSLSYMQEIIQNVQKHTTTPIILFSKGCGHSLTTIAQTGCTAVGLDWMQDLAIAREQVGQQVAIQGNLDPSVLLSEPQVVRAEVMSVLQQFDSHPGHIFNLGHGITPDVPPDNVKVLVETVQQFNQH